MPPKRNNRFEVLKTNKSENIFKRNIDDRPNNNRFSGLKVKKNIFKRDDNEERVNSSRFSSLNRNNFNSRNRDDRNNYNSRNRDRRNNYNSRNYDDRNYDDRNNFNSRNRDGRNNYNSRNNRGFRGRNRFNVPRENQKKYTDTHVGKFKKIGCFDFDSVLKKQNQEKKDIKKEIKIVEKKENSRIIEKNIKENGKSFKILKKDEDEDYQITEEERQATLSLAMKYQYYTESEEEEEEEEEVDDFGRPNNDNSAW